MTQRNDIPQGSFEYSERAWNEAESKWEWFTVIDPNPTEGEGWAFTPAR